MVKEIQIENKVREYARVNLHIESIKLNLAGNRGWSDVMFMYDGQVYFVEFKRPGEVPTDLQKYRLSWLLAHGFHAIWSDNAEYVLEQLRRWKQSIVGNASHM